MRHLSLISRHSAGAKYPEGVVVALNPRACFDLERDGVVFQTPDSMHDRARFFQDEESYAHSQLEWLDGMDVVLSGHVHELAGLPIRPLRLYAYHFKMLVDPLFEACSIVEAIFNKLRPDRVRFYGERPRGGGLSDSFVQYDGADLYSVVVETLCAQMRIDCALHHVDSQAVEPGAARRGAAALRRALASSPVIRSFKNLCERKNPAFRSRRQAGRKFAFLFLDLNYGFNDLAAGVLEDGHRAYFSDQDRLYRLVLPGPICVPAATRSIQRPASETDWDALPGIMLDKHDFFRWVRERVRFDFSEFLRPYAVAFFRVILPRLLRSARWHEETIRSRNIDYVMGNGNRTLEQSAAMGISSILPNVESIMLMHGFGAFQQNFDTTELPCNIYLTPDEEQNQFMTQELGRSKGVRPRCVLACDLLLRAYESHSRQRLERLKRRPPGRKTTVIFIPTMVYGHNRRLESLFYSDTMLYALHKEILKYFAAQNDFQFVWKALKQAGGISPIRFDIENLNASHVAYSEGNLVDALKNADLAIMDYPSTPLLETMALGIPTLSLYPGYMKIRKTALAKFHEALHRYDTPEDALRLIDRFLRDGRHGAPADPGSPAVLEFSRILEQISRPSQ
jgi:hypothetical protein